MYRSQTATAPRRGMILLVVLCLLTLFAIIGITFVLYAESMAAAARLNKDSQIVNPPTVDPATRIAINTFMGSFANGSLNLENAMRGLDLGTNLYGGYGSATSPAGIAAPTTPFGGTGRLHFSYSSGIFTGLDDFDIVNYQYYSNDGMRHDPECYDSTGSFYAATSTGSNTTSGTPKPYVGGFNPPYTYPDKNHIFLGAIRALDGAVIARSFHRDYGPFGSLDPTNPNWGTGSPPAYTSSSGVSAANVKYLVLRPHPSYHTYTSTAGTTTSFPVPADIGGDVKNLSWSPGFVDATGTLHPSTKDSFWIDVGAPVQSGPNNTYFKMLIAPFIIDLDGLLNVNAAGNVRGLPVVPGTTPPTSASNLGLGPWEINPGMVLDYSNTTVTPAQPEYPYLFVQRPTAPMTYGRYGADLKPGYGSTTVIAPPRRSPHYYAQLDYDAVYAYSSTIMPYAYGTTSGPVSSFFPAGTNLFPNYPPGYENYGGTTSIPAAELVDHPLLYNPFAPLPQSPSTPGQYDQRYSTSDMELVLRWGDVGSQTLSSGLVNQIPFNLNLNVNADALNVPRRRLQITTDSADFIVAGVTPYVTTQTAGSYAISTTSPPPSGSPAPQGAAIPFPTLTSTNLPGGTPGTPGGEFNYTTTTNWQYNFGPYLNGTNTIVSGLRRLNLNRTLTQYPTYVLSSRHDDNSVNPTTSAQYQQANQDRQQFADDIYRTLLVVTGTPLPVNPAAPTDAELAPMRWLAQLAVNIVDYIDEDNINTVYNFYGTKDGLPPANLADVYGTNPDVPKYWVAGTELPRLVLNEVLAESANSSASGVTLPMGQVPNVKIWAELLNPLNGSTTMLQTQDGGSVPLQVAAIATSAATTGNATAYAPYRLVVTTPTTGNPDGFAQTPVNPFGAADIAPNTPVVSTLDSDFNTTATNPLTYYPSTTQPASTIPTVGVYGTGMGTTPYFLLGPATDSGTTSGTASTTWEADPLAGTSTLIPTNTPFLRIGTANSPSNSGLSYFPTGWTAASTTDQRTFGATILLRRLANPQAPADPNPTVGTGSAAVPNPWYNPYITIDFIDQVPIRDPNQDAGPPGTNPYYSTRGKMQPLVAKTVLTPPGGTNIRTVDTTNSQVQDQAAPATLDTNCKPTGTSTLTGIYHTFGQTNNNPVAPNFTWLVHLDRQLISPMELLHVSAYPPHQLTQQFITGSLTAQQFNHLAPWFDQDLTATPTNSHRLYRLFEFLDTSTLPSWSNIGNRFPGKINLNTIWETPGLRSGSPTTYNEVFRALCDSNPNNFFNRDTTTSYNGIAPYNTVPDAILLNLLNSRTPNSGIPWDPNSTTSPPDRPILSMATGLDTGGTGTQFPAGHSINDTIFRPLTGGATLINGPQMLFEDPYDTATTHPYQRYQLLTKIFNNVTNRSNCFAIWMTAGYFPVAPPTSPGPPPVFPIPPILSGPEIGLAGGTNVRHRAFLIVDRTKMQVYQTALKVPISTSPPATYMPATYAVSDLSTVLEYTSGSNPSTSATWTLAAGQVLVIEPGTVNEEAVVVTGSSPGPYGAIFTKGHPNGAAVIIRGNPGPLPLNTNYDYRQDPSVIYASVIF